MTFRDDRDGLRARIDELEEALAEARADAARLRRRLRKARVRRKKLDDASDELQHAAEQLEKLSAERVRANRLEHELGEARLELGGLRDRLARSRGEARIDPAIAYPIFALIAVVAVVAAVVKGCA